MTDRQYHRFTNRRPSFTAGDASDDQQLSSLVGNSWLVILLLIMGQSLSQSSVMSGVTMMRGGVRQGCHTRATFNTDSSAVTRL